MLISDPGGGSYLFISGASSGHQVEVEASQTQDREEEQPRYADDDQPGRLVKEKQLPVRP